MLKAGLLVLVALFASSCGAECVGSFQCSAGQVCTDGQCVADASKLQIRLTEPANNSELTPGATVDVVGKVTVGKLPVTVTLDANDQAGCTPFLPVSTTLQPTDSAGEQEFRFASVPVGDRGGTFKATATLGSKSATATAVYRSSDRCPDCPSITLSAPSSPDLGEHAMSALIRAQIGNGNFTPQLLSIRPDASEYSVLWPSGSLDSIPIPVGPGPSNVGLRIRSPGGTTRTCLRAVETTAPLAALSAHLSWSSDVTDLDLQVVPPNGRAGATACRARSALSFCNFVTDDVAAFGPEAALINPLADGAWGVLVIAVPGEGGPAAASVSITAQGETLWLAGPRMLNPLNPDTWLVARIVVTAGVPRVEPINEVVAGPVETDPATW